MPLIDKLESIFNIETEASVESNMREFVTAGANIKQKTIFPFVPQVMGLSFLNQLGKDIDEQFSDVIRVLNMSQGIPLMKGDKVKDRKSVV